MKKKLNQLYALARRHKKTFLVMRCLLFFALISIFQVSAEVVYSQNARLSIDLSKTSIKNVLSEIEAKSEFYFLYNNKLIDVERIVSIKVKDEKIETILKTLFEGENVDFLVKDRHVVITPLEKKELVNPKKIKGKVQNSTGEFLPGVTVLLKGTATGTVTDIDGKFSLSDIEDGATLIFSFVGLKKQEIFVGQQKDFTVIMQDTDLMLDEVVSIGYGVVKKSDLTGSVSTIGSDKLKDRSTGDIGSLIQGKASGVDVSQGKIRIRGVTTFNNTDPLIVVDGFLGASMSTINPNDIKSIEVLKDASSTAIYGSRGANGVILITTKSGEVGKLKVNVNGFYGFAQTPKKLGVLNSEQYIDFINDLFENDGRPGTKPSAKLSANAPGSGEGVRKTVTNWQNEVFRVAKNSEVNVDFSGGTENATFFLSLGYKTNQGIVGTQSSNQFLLRSKNDYTIKKWFKAGTNISANYSTHNGNGLWDYLDVYKMPPYMAVKDPNNYWGYSNTDRATDMSDTYNPMTFLHFGETENGNLQYEGNVWFSISPINGLTYRFQGGVNGQFGRDFSWQDKFENSSNLYKNHLNESSSYSFIPVIESTLTYAKKIGIHDFSAMIGNTWQDYASGGSIGIFAEDFANTEIKKYSFATSSRISHQNSWDYAFLSYFGRVNYQLMDKYLLTFNIRRDASPRFASHTRWGTFPSLSLAWKITNESFMKNQNLFDLLKLRASWGISGNDAIGDFRYVSRIYAKGVYYPLGGLALPGATVRDNAAFDIHWEKTETRNIGVDMSFLANSLSINTDVFMKKTSDILFSVPRPASMGYGASYGGDAIVNAASCDNKGFEFQVDYKNNFRDFKYSVGANYTYVDNSVTSLGLGQPYLAGNSRTDIGNPIGYFYGFVADGIYKTNTEVVESNKLAVEKGFKYFQEKNTGAGDVRFKDLNGDGQITWEKDRTKIGNAIPKHMFGFNISLDYKGFDLNAYLSGIAGSNIFMSSPSIISGTSVNNQLDVVLDRWRSEAEPGNGKQPRAVLGDPNNNYRPSTLLVSSGDYLKLRQLSIGYSIPASLIEKGGFNRVRVYGSLNNVSLTKYAGFDKEVGGDNLSRGYDGYWFPNPVSLIFGIQLGL